MTERRLQAISVNVHRSSHRTHALLQKGDEYDIILIQEPWFNTVATLHSDTDPTGEPQMGATANPMWDTHLPKHRQGETCKVVAYTKQSLVRSHIVSNNLAHPLANANTVILDIMETDTIIMRLISLYHTVPPSGHDLQHLLDYESDELTPTLLIGDFNTHSPCWSLHGRTHSSWAPCLYDWLDINNLSLLNPLHEPTWYGNKDADHPSVLDLAFGNEAALIGGQIGPIKISEQDSLGSDHAALLFKVYPTDSLAIIPPPAPKGYQTNEEKKTDWIKAFMTLLPCSLIMDDDSEPQGIELLRNKIKQFNYVIKEASRQTLKPKQAVDPRGVQWWNDECSAAHTLARIASTHEEKCKANKALRNTVAHAKRTWAYEQLHHATNSKDIWRLAKTRKGHTTNSFPALRDVTNTLVD